MNIFSKKIFMILVIMGIILSLLSGFFFYQKETSALKKQLNKDINYQVKTFKSELFLNLEPMHLVQSIFTKALNINEDKFLGLSNIILKDHNNIKSIFWVSNKMLKNNLYYDKNKEYLLIKYAASNKKTPLVRTYDLYSNMIFREFFKNFLKNKEDIYISSIELSLSLLNTKNLLVFLPIYKNSFLSGFIFYELDINSIFEETFSFSKNRELSLILEDITDNNIMTLYKKESISKIDKTLEVKNVFNNIGGRVWQVTVTAGTLYTKSIRTFFPYLISLIGIAFVLLGAFYTFLIIKRNLIVAKLVKEKTNQLRSVNKKLELLSRTDSLTNIANRRYFNEYIQQEWSRAIREKMPLSIIMCDVDYFKQYNDTYGHLEGDECLKNIASCLKESLHRPSDLLARYGGEEFIMVLPNTQNALSFAKNILKNIENLEILHKSSNISKFVTVSIGIVTVIPKRDSSALEFLQKADDALYEAKANGRNKAVYHDNSININKNNI